MWSKLGTSVAAIRFFCVSATNRSLNFDGITALNSVASFLSEIDDELLLLEAKSFVAPDDLPLHELLDVWAFELEFLCGRIELIEKSEDADTLVRVLADLFRKLGAILQNEKDRMSELIDFILVTDALTNDIVASVESAGTDSKFAA
ncbi:MAG: hypothetical protein P1U58_01390 [Verrucomicrobiales bacterium]|nr:hypothetical protein [Verrucomicrobiales bacterium]